ncbi:hypothetical protein M885DRAFT_612742 [Pelagophyceae sp. CCMP2097]|nr:hypothetical protein M885DRAFT_612742 [Pelagophyceae sp. CCMP2097]
MSLSNGHKLTPGNILAGAAAWELMFLGSRLFVKTLARHRRSLVLAKDEGERDAKWRKLEREGPSYVVAGVHALLVGARGAYHLVTLVGVPTPMQFAMPTAGSALYSLTEATEVTNAIFFSWIIYDVCHVVFSFPRLGSWDTLAHHLCFAFTAAVCGAYRVLPFPFGWLICGELSTPFLNLRWLLINSGRGDSKLAQKTNVVFGLLFMATRMLLYGSGLAHLGYNRAVLFDQTSLVPKPLLYTTLALFVAAYGLNMLWMSKILKMARGGGKRKAK